MIIIMNTILITISVPKYIHGQLMRYVPVRKRSLFVSQAIGQKLLESNKTPAENPWDRLLHTAKKLNPQPEAFNKWLNERHTGLI